jgi:hypothetical protein
MDFGQYIGKLPAALTITTEPYPKDTVLRAPLMPAITAMPSTPVAPVSSEALISLPNLIMKQDADALGELSKQRLQRHIQKFVNAAQTLLAKGSLQQDRIRFLIRINNEAKPRRSAKAEILAKGEGRRESDEL